MLNRISKASLADSFVMSSVESNSSDSESGSLKYIYFHEIFNLM